MLALICNTLPDYTLILAIKHIGSTMTSILVSKEPVIAVVICVICFVEQLDILIIIGIILIVFAVVLVITQTHRDMVVENNKE